MLTKTQKFELFALVCLWCGALVATAGSYYNDFPSTIDIFSNVVPLSCDYYVSNRVALGYTSQPCPYRATTLANTTFINATNTSQLTVQGGMGWCGVYTYPQYGVVPIDPFYIGDQDHTLHITLPLPWCVSASAFFGCVTIRPSLWAPPTVLYNRRPLGLFLASQTPCGSNYSTSNITGPGPTVYPLWDEGGYHRRTVTMQVNDSCVPIFNTTSGTFYNVQAKINYLFVANNATYIDVSNTSKTHLHWWSRTGSPSSYTAGSVFAYEICKGDCKSFFEINCTNPVRTVPRDIFPTRVELACRDPVYGYLWRVSNEGAPNLHMDWQIVRTIENTTVKVLPLPEPPLFMFPSIPSDVVLPGNFDANLYVRLRAWSSVTTYNPVVDAYHGYDLWPNATLKHGVAAGSYFYLPAFADSAATMVVNNRSIALGVERPSLLRLYAGRPDHYVGTVALGALVAYYDWESLLNMPTLRGPGMLNVTAIQERTYFNADITRQTLLEICSNASARILVVGTLTLPPTANLTRFCSYIVLNQTALWNETVATVFAMFFPNTTVIDPMGDCSCVDEVHSPCDTATISTRPALLRDYTNRPPAAPVNLTVEPVCRMTGPLPLLNIPPLPNLTNVPGSYAVATDLTLPSFYSRLLAPLTVTNSPPFVVVNYSIGPWGVVWRINNEDNDTTHASVPIRWEVGHYVPPNGTTAGQLITVPFSVGSATSFSLNSYKSYWLFSRTLDPHKLYGNARIPCTSPSTCAATYPSDPPNPAWPVSNVFDEAVDAAAIAALPVCACYVNVPCSTSQFLFTTDRNVSVSSLPAALPPPNAPIVFINVSIPSNCTPYPEICNGLDDNCDGLVDNLPGAGSTCSTNFIHGPCSLSPGILQCVNASNTTNVTGTLECVGQVLPQPEQCGLVDYDCDGLPGNVPGRDQPCGSNVGACRNGTLRCILPNPVPVCDGEIPPLPTEICGNGIDDDCNGLVDDRCGGSGGGGPTPTPTGLAPMPSATPLPPVNSPVVTPVPPPSSIGKKITNGIANFFGIDAGTFQFDHRVWLPIAFIVLLIIVAGSAAQQQQNVIYLRRKRARSNSQTEKDKDS